MLGGRNILTHQITTLPAFFITGNDMKGGMKEYGK